MGIVIGALFTVALLFMAATSPRAFLVVLTLALASLVAWYYLSPEPKFEVPLPPRVMAP